MLKFYTVYLLYFVGTQCDVPPTIDKDPSMYAPPTSTGSLLALRAPCASSEDLTFRDSSPEDADSSDDDDGTGGVCIRRQEATPTPSDVSLDNDDERTDDSLAVTPVHQPRTSQDDHVELCLDNKLEEEEGKP